MPFKHACFVSYRRGKGELAKRFITDLAEALKNEIELWLGGDRTVYPDREELRPGDMFNQGSRDSSLRKYVHGHGVHPNLA